MNMFSTRPYSLYDFDLYTATQILDTFCPNFVLLRTAHKPFQVMPPKHNLFSAVLHKIISLLFCRRVCIPAIIGVSIYQCCFMRSCSKWSWWSLTRSKQFYGKKKPFGTTYFFPSKSRRKTKFSDQTKASSCISASYVIL